MSPLEIVLCVVYIIGLLITLGICCTRDDLDAGGATLITLIWPLIVLFAPLVFIAIGLFLLGEKIGSQFK